MSRITARRHSLHGAEEDERADVLRERAADRREREHDQATENDRTPAEAVGERAMKQIHDREAEQVRRQRLLHLDRCRADRAGDAGEGRQVGVDREWPEHAEAGEQHRQGPIGCLPQGACVGVHAAGSV
jgi:hypothetical protein